MLGNVVTFSKDFDLVSGTVERRGSKLHSYKLLLVF